jgi:L-threonylcarbamoyladenylate synthase
MENNHAAIIKCLNQSGVIAYPTETVYGLGCDPFQREAVEKVFALKGRELKQSPLILVPDLKWLEKLTKKIDPAMARLVDRFWPGPLTIVFNASKMIPPWLIRDDETVAIRISSHPWVKSFFEQYQKPLISTSANRSGQSSAKSIGEVKSYFPKGIDYYVDEGVLRNSQSSTIVSVSDDSVHLIRRGAIQLSDLTEALHGTSPVL